MNLPILFLVLFVLKKDNLISASFQEYRNLIRRLEGLDVYENGISGGTYPVLVQAPSATSAPQGNLQFEVGSVDTGPGSVSISGITAVSGSSLIIRRGVDCGYQEVNGGDVIEVSSRNYNVSNYFNNEACTWKFEGNRCTLSAFCPCVDFPSSPFCLEDYLRITDKYNFDQRYCGGNKPRSPLISNSDSLTIRYRTDRRTTATGFVCYVSCAAPGSDTIRNITSAYPCPSTAVTPLITG